MIGGSIFDIVTSVSEPEIHTDGRTHPGSVSFGLGGVGREEGRSISVSHGRFRHPWIRITNCHRLVL